MNWHRYREYQGGWQHEVVLAYDPADKGDPFLKFRTQEYREAGKMVRLQALRNDPSDRQRNGK
ncbi:MAG TPA: hypothetical protein PKG77_22560 [Phycisphaerae bacterium]|nr:hypothetical protein [Phycisphaerae bacterium]HQL73933.1 hypothetical protein [Phycisphaerae bacterium]